MYITLYIYGTANIKGNRKYLNVRNKYKMLKKPRKKNVRKSNGAKCISKS